MPNAIKYNASTETLALKKGNFWIGTGDVGKGPTSSTGYYNGITPPSGGFTIYLNKASDGPAIYTVSTEAQLTALTNRIAGTNYTTSGQCLNYFATQTDKMIFNRDYEPIVTNGLVMNIDAGFTPSYPTTGTTWYNLGLSGNNGNLINGPIFNPNDGGSIVCDGVDDYVSYSTATLTTFTIDITYSPLVFDTNASNNRYNYILGSFGSNIFCRYNALNSGNNILLANHSGADIGIGSLGHVVNGIYNIVITFDDSTKNTKVFINSSLVRETTYNATLKYQSSITLGDTFNSKFLNHRVYNRVLTNSEILQNYYAMLNTRMIVTNGLVLNLQAGNSNSYTPGSNMWNDMSGYGNNFTLVNNPTFNTSNGGYLQFDGADDYAYLAVNSSIRVGTSCSLEMVIKNDYSMRMGQAGGYWSYGFEGVGFSHTCGGNGNISPYFIANGFHHYVFTWNQAQNNHSMYRDGVLVYSFTPTCGFNAGEGGFFVLGGAYGPSSFQSYGTPHIATLRLYNRILTDAEVVQNSNLMKTQFGI
jgi:hypothetical protein